MSCDVNGCKPLPAGTDTGGFSAIINADRIELRRGLTLVHVRALLDAVDRRAQVELKSEGV
jgi:hypothetical protein